MIVFEPHPAPPHAPATHAGFGFRRTSRAWASTLASERRTEQIPKQGNRLDFGLGGRTCTGRVKRYDDGNNTKLQLCGTDGGDRRQATGRGGARQRTTSYYYTTYGDDAEMGRCCRERNPRKRRPREYTTARGGDDPSESTQRYTREITSERHTDTACSPEAQSVHVVPQ